jgi:polyhydroxyalkanoate synthesis repressor PhaR
LSSDKKPTESDKAATPIRIKKYPNRRLYDTSRGKYIVLDDIVTLVKSGTEFIIEDTKTGDDLTRSILNQIIYERETAKADFHFPLDVQKQLILMYDDAYGKMMPDYLRESMNLFVSERSKMEDAFEDIVSINSKNMAKFAENLAEQNMQYFNRAFDFFQTMSGMKSDKPTNEKDVDSEKDKDDKSSKLKDIQDQINALQKELKSLS